MSISEKLVYELLRECDSLTNAELATKIGKGEKTVYRAIDLLNENGYIVCMGSNASGYWKVIK